MRGIGLALNRFWFAPTSTATLAVVRILFGLVSLGWTISLAPDLMTFFSRSGIVPAQPSNRWWWSILQVFPSDGAVIAVWVLLLVGCVFLTIGFLTRVAAVVVFIGILSLERRNPFLFNSGDVLVRNVAFYLTLAPAGVALSVDRWRKARDRFWSFPERAPWALRLIQLQISILYAATVWSKVRGTSWNNGTAVSFALRLDDISRFHAPSFITRSLILTNLLTFGTLAIETALAFLIWNRRARPWVIALGVSLHLGIALGIMIGFFSAVIFVGYVAFVPPETMHSLLNRIASRLARSRWRFLRGLRATSDPSSVEHVSNAGGSLESVSPQ
jgi:vitamin K-dependent gamma-carboxylase-like protein